MQNTIKIFSISSWMPVIEIVESEMTDSIKFVG